MTENYDGIYVHHNLWRKLWRTNLICDGRTCAREKREFCDGWFEICNGKSVPILKFVIICDGSITIRHKLRTSVADCDGSVTILGPIFFCFRCPINCRTLLILPLISLRLLLLSTYPGAHNPPHTPTTLYSTTSATDDRRERHISAGVAGLVSRPVHLAKIVQLGLKEIGAERDRQWG